MVRDRGVRRIVAGRPMKRAFALAVAMVALLGVAPANTQAIDVATLIANQSSTTYTWKTSAPATSAQLVTWTNLQAYINTKACYMATGAQVVAWRDVLACSAASSTSAHSTSLSGTASGAATCNLSCVNSGGSAQAAQPFVQTFTANSVSSANPVSYSLTITPGTSATCSWTLTDAASTARASGTASASGTVTAGTTGTWTLEVDETTAAAQNALTCTVSGSVTSYY